MSSKKRGDPVPYEEIEGRRRSSHLYIADGFGYRVKYTKRDMLYMACVTKVCPATATLNVVKRLLVPKQNHTHPPTPEEFAKIKFIASLKRKVEHTDLEVKDFFQTELEKANVKNPHDYGLDYRKLVSMLAKTKKTKKQFNQINPRDNWDTWPSNLLRDLDLETIGPLPPFSPGPDTNSANMEPVWEAHPMEVGGEDSPNEDTSSQDGRVGIDSSQPSQAVQESIDGSSEQNPGSVVTAATEGKYSSQNSEHASDAHAAEQQPVTAPSEDTHTSGPDSYQVRHNNHLNVVLNQLAEDEAFMDVTLTAEGRQVKAHKNVLAAVSPYFSNILRSNPCKHPIVIMPNDVRHEQLVQIIAFVYRGEVNVPSTDLAPLMKVADQLLITGLSQKGNKNPLRDFNISDSEEPTPIPFSSLSDAQHTASSAPQASASSAPRASASSGLRASASSTPRTSASSAPRKSASSAPRKSASSAPPKSASSSPPKSASSAPPKSASSAPPKSAPSAPRTSASSTSKASVSSVPQHPASSTPGIPTSFTPQTPASFAPQTPASFAPQTPASFAPQTSASFTPQTPASFASQTPTSFAPQNPTSLARQNPTSLAPQNSTLFAPRNSTSIAPQTPASFAPQTPASFAPQTPASFAPQTPASFAPQTPASFAPQTPASFAPQTPASFAPQTPASFAPQTPASLSEQSGTDFAIAGTSGGHHYDLLDECSNLTYGSNGNGSCSETGQSSTAVTDACLPSMMDSVENSDDSDGFGDEFLDTTPLGSPSNDTPVVDVDIEMIKEESFHDEPTVESTDELQEDLLDKLGSSSNLPIPGPQDNLPALGPSSNNLSIPAPSANNSPIPAPSSNNSPIPAPSSNNPPIPAPSSNNPPIPGPSSNNPPIPGPSSNNPPIPGPSSNNSPIPAPSSNNPPIPGPSSNNPPIPGPSSNNPPIPGPSSNNLPVPAPQDDLPVVFDPNESATTTPNPPTKVSLSVTPRITRRSATMNNSAVTSASCNLNPVVRLKKVSLRARASYRGSSTAKNSRLGNTNQSAMEHDPYVCPYCCQVFSDLTEHFTSHHITQPAFICSRCCRVYTDKAVFIAHRAKCN